MRMVRLGTTTIELSEIAAGAPIAPVPVARGVDLLNEGWDAGIRAVDVRDGTAEQETAAARWLEDRQPEDVVLLVGLGRPADPGRGSDLSPARLDRELTQVLRRLGRADLVWTRGTDAETALEATLTTLADAIEAGRVRAWGAADLGVRDLEALLTAADRAGLPRPAFVRNRMHLLDRRDERDLLPLATGEGLGAVPHGVLAGGRLTDRHVEREEAEEAAARAGTARTTPTDPDLARLLVLRGLARERDVSVEALALAWLVGHPSVTAGIVAPRAAAEWDAVHEAATIDLDAEERERLDDL